MRKALCLLLVLIGSIVLSSCKQSSDVVSNGWIQKRKHRQGFHVDIGHNNQRGAHSVDQKAKSPRLAELLKKEPPPVINTSSDSTETKLAKRLLTEVVDQAKEHNWPGLSFTKRASIWKDQDERLFFKKRPFLNRQDELEDLKEENNQKLLMSLAGFLGGMLDIVTVITLSLLGIESGIFFISAIIFPAAIYAVPICAILVLVYLKEKKTLQAGETIFTPRFYYKTERLAMIFSVLATIITFVGTVSAILIFSQNLTNTFPIIPLIVWVCSLAAFGLNLIPAVVTIILSINKSDLAKYALLILIVGTLIAFVLGLIVGLVALAVILA